MERPCVCKCRGNRLWAATDDQPLDESPWPFRVGGPATSPWREHALARATEYRFLARWLLTEERDERKLAALRMVERQIDAAEHSAEGEDTGHFWRLWRNDKQNSPKTLDNWAKLKAIVGGSAVERTNSQLDAVEVDLLRLAPDPYLRGALPNLVAHVRSHLEPEDPRRRRVECVERKVATRPDQQLRKLERDQVLGAVRSASLEARREIRRVRSFRNVLLVTALILALGAAGVITLGVLEPGRIALCFVPDDELVVCPTSSVEVPPEDQTAPGEQSPSPEQQAKIDRLVRDTASPWDIPVMAIVGLLAAGLAGAFAVREIQGTSTPYSLPVSAAILKLPTGALTAVVGLLLMRGGFVPGLSALDTSAQIIAWAIIFGYSQQLLTRFVDQQANTVLQKVDEPTHAQLDIPYEAVAPPDKPGTSPPTAQPA